MKGKAVVLAVMLALAPVTQPPAAVAQAAGGDAEVERFDREKLIDYTACAVGIVFAVTAQQWWGVGLGCGNMIAKHWTD